MPTESLPVPITASETVTALNSVAEVASKPPATPGLPPRRVGRESLPSSLTSSQEQMLLGTMLGDGGMAFQNRNPSYRSFHGYKQHEYNCRKYQVLAEFVRTPPKKTKNGGYGEWSSRWATLTSPALLPIASLCLRDGKKYVTEAWAARLTWESLAWWYMDDGSLATTQANFHTQGFTLEEVEVLAKRLEELGLKTGIYHQKSRHSARVYHVLHLMTEPTRMFVENIRPFVFPEMAYKIALPERTTEMTCFWCQTIFPRVSYSKVPARPCCGAPNCRQAKMLAASRRYHAVPENRTKQRQRVRDRYAADLEASRKQARESAVIYRKKNPESHRAAKKRMRAKKKLLRQAETWVCATCGLTELRGNKHANMRHCVTCRPAVTSAIKKKSELKQRGSRKLT